MYYKLQFMDYTILSSQLLIYLLLWHCLSHLSHGLFYLNHACLVNLDSHDSDKNAQLTLMCSFWQLWQAHSHNSDKLTPTTLTSSHLKTWHAHFHNWYSCFLNSEIVKFKALTCTVSPLCHPWSHRSDMLTLVGLIISLCWEQATSGRSVIADSGETGFAYQQNVNRSRSNMQSSETLWATSPVLLSTSRCSQTPQELGKVLSDSATALSGCYEIWLIG